MHLSTTHHLKIMQQYKIRWKVFLPLRPASWFLIIFLIKSILDKSTDYELILILSEANMQLSIKFIKKQNNNTKYKFIFKIGNIIIVIKKKKKVIIMIMALLYVFCKLLSWTFCFISKTHGFKSEIHVFVSQEQK